MGQTLNHGVYLPAEGERNCYSGLASNWNLLDTAIGDIAGKASATHTHGNITNDGKVGTTANLPLITGTSGTITTGSFGTSANTFCEGNDSRLSDARTPVAHTHGKADITDLLNSNFIPSANNSYDLGSSSYQWNNLYAKNYYYNGTAWGLDKSNVWTGDNTFSNTLKQVNSTVTKGTNPQSDTNAFNMYWGGTGVSNLNNALFSQRGIVYADGSTTYVLYALENASAGTHTSLSLKYDPNDTINKRSALMRGDFRPYYDNSFNLGISTHKWKTLNGVNPGALSLPNLDATIGSTYDKKQDISGDLVPDSYNNARFTARMPGWVYIDFNVSNATITAGTQMLVQFKDNNLANTTFAINFECTPSTDHILIYAPVIANRTYILDLNFTGQSIEKAYVIPCFGNV